MTRHDPLLRLLHLRDHAGEAIALAAGRSRAGLNADRLLNLALGRLLEIVGEAAATTPSSLRDRYPAIPRGPMIAPRNRLIHGYDGIDLDIVWHIVTDDLSPPSEQIDRAIASLP